MAVIKITAEEVAACKACPHPAAQQHTVQCHDYEENKTYVNQVCEVCGGVLENGVLINPLYPGEVLVGRHKENIKAAQLRAGMRA